MAFTVLQYQFIAEMLYIEGSKEEIDFCMSSGPHNYW